MEVNIEQKQWFWGNGNLQTEENYVNGKLSGLSKCWYESGQLQSEWTYVDGKETETFTCWFESGNLKTESRYIDDKQTSIRKCWYESGNLETNNSFRDAFNDMVASMESSVKKTSRPQVANQEDKYDKLKKLKVLLDDGVLTIEEFNKEKKKLLENK